MPGSNGNKNNKQCRLGILGPSVSWTEGGSGIHDGAVWTCIDGSIAAIPRPARSQLTGVGGSGYTTQQQAKAGGLGDFGEIPNEVWAAERLSLFTPHHWRENLHRPRWGWWTGVPSTSEMFHHLILRLEPALSGSDGASLDLGQAWIGSCEASRWPR